MSIGPCAKKKKKQRTRAHTHSEAPRLKMEKDDLPVTDASPPRRVHLFTRSLSETRTGKLRLCSHATPAEVSG